MADDTSPVWVLYWVWLAGGIVVATADQFGWAAVACVFAAGLAHVARRDA